MSFNNNTHHTRVLKKIIIKKQPAHGSKNLGAVMLKTVGWKDRD